MENKSNNPVIVVSGLPRSGTSLMMQILESFGISLFTDGVRQADWNNPKGYYEFEKVKQLKNDSSWVVEAEGQGLKVISLLLYNLPVSYSYKVIFMNRDLDEILASQQKMQQFYGKSDSLCEETLRQTFEHHLKSVKHWLANQNNFDFFDCDYNGLLREPEDNLAKLADFLQIQPDLSKATKVIDPRLYRNRQC